VEYRVLNSESIIENSPCWRYEFGDLPFAFAVVACVGVRSSQFAAVGAGDQGCCRSGQSVRDVTGQAEGQSQEGAETSQVPGATYCSGVLFIPLHAAGDQPPLKLFLGAE